MADNILTEMVRYFGSDASRINHALKVYGFAMAIAASENVDTQTHKVLGLASALHDIGIPEAERKYGSSAGDLQEREGPPVARGLLDKLGVDAQTVDRVCYLIGNHHSYQKIDGPDFQILVEADFLVNIFEDAMGRNAVESVKKTVFRTESGTRLLEGIYLR